MGAAKKVPTLEQEISALVADAEALRERADQLLDLYAEKRRPASLPGPMLRRMWETKSLTHDPILALSFALQEAGNN
jgi:hypothetical protein